ncbi:MAG: response regulator [Chitinophagaceae bacterium]
MEAIHILLAEDNEGDIMLTKEAFAASKLYVRLSVVKDGQEAIDFLTAAGQYAGAQLPDMVMLDINLPRKNGHEVLKFIKENNGLKHIPVVMLTTSSLERDITRSYQNHVNCYIVKPVEVDAFLALITEIESFWISIVKLPVKLNVR